MTVECCLFYPTPSPRLTICSIIEMLARSTVTANIFQLGPGPATRRHGPRGWEPWSPRSHTFVLGHFPNMENNNESGPQLAPQFSSWAGQGPGVCYKWWWVWRCELWTVLPHSRPGWWLLTIGATKTWRGDKNLTRLINYYCQSVQCSAVLVPVDPHLTALHGTEDHHHLHQGLQFLPGSRLVPAARCYGSYYPWCL